MPIMQRTLSTASGRSIRDVALVKREARRLVGLERRRRGLRAGTLSVDNLRAY
jgi:hypothetical protein